MSFLKLIRRSIYTGRIKNGRLQHHRLYLQDKIMKSTFVILFIGAIIAVALAAPSRKVLEQDDNDDKLAKAVRWLNVARDIISSLDKSINGDMIAMNQEDDSDGDDLLTRALLDSIQEKVAAQDGDDDNDDDDDDDDARGQFSVHVHFG